MKKVLIFALVIFCLSLTACNTNDNSKGVVFSQAQMVTFTLDQAIRMSEVIAQVEIVKKLNEEVRGDIPKHYFTYFEIKFKEIYKGNVKPNDKSKMIVNGSSKAVFNGIPASIYENGNEYIMFLFKSKESNGQYYTILGGYPGAYRITELDGKGVIYGFEDGKEELIMMKDASLETKVKEFREKTKKEYEEDQLIYAMNKDTFIKYLKEKISSKSE